MIESIRRTDATILLEINTGVCIKSPIVWFSFDAGTEMSAELLRRHLYDLRFESKKATAKDCLMYLSKEEISKLKSRLVHEWDGRKHCWK